MIYVYVLTYCAICNIIKKKIFELKLDKNFTFIDESSFMIPSNEMKNFKISFPCFFKIINNKKILLDRNKIINRLFIRENI